MEANQHEQFKRWYQQYPNLNAILLCTEFLKTPVQTRIGDRLQDILKPHLQVIEHKGIEAGERDYFLHLSRSFEKKRWYDRIPTLYESLNQMVFLPHETLVLIDYECQALKDYILSTYKYKIKSQLKNHPELASLGLDGIGSI